MYICRFQTSFRYSVNGLWHKLLYSGINGICFTYIQNMYKGIKSKYTFMFFICFFNCKVCIRQWENEKFIPVFVFVKYIYDSEDYLLDRNLTGPSTNTEGIKMKMRTREYMCFRGNLIRHNANDSVACTRLAPGP